MSQTAGTINLGDAAVTAAVTGQVITSGVSAQSAAQAFIDRLQGAASVTLQANFTYGSGGTSLDATVETSLDQGASWTEIARFSFTTASVRKVMNVSGADKIEAAYTATAALSGDTAKSGILGDRLRAKITSVGVYAGNTSISLRAVIR